MYDDGLYDKMLDHVGHKLVCVTYGGEDGVWNVAIECETCGEVIVDRDSPEGEES